MDVSVETQLEGTLSIYDSSTVSASYLIAEKTTLDEIGISTYLSSSNVAVVKFSLFSDSFNFRVYYRKVLRDATMSYAPTDVSMWTIYNAYSTGGSYIALVGSYDTNKDAAMWANAAYLPASVPNFALKVTAATSYNDENAFGYVIFFVDSTSRVIPATNAVPGQQFGVDWSAFQGLAIFSGVKDIYSHFQSSPTSYGPIWPSCRADGSLPGNYSCGAWSNDLPGSQHYLLIAVDDARYVRITLCINGDYPCYAVRSYQYVLTTPLTDLTGPVYFGIASHSSDVSSYTYSYIYAVDFYAPTASCPNNCYGHGFCLSNSTCACHPGFQGVDCIGPTCEQTCLNGGSCVAPDTCLCADGFAGYNCSDGK